MTQASVKTVLRSGKTSATKYKIELIHKTAGIEPAGSGTRETKECWGIIIYPKGQGFVAGQWFKTLEDAETALNKRIVP